MHVFIYLIAILLMIMAQTMVSNAYARYSGVSSLKGYTGEMVAHLILEKNQVAGVDVCVSEKGRADNSYDAKLKRVCLSEDVYYGNSVNAISIAAHECGHALQDRDDFTVVIWRNALAPYVNICSQSGWAIVLIGMVLGSSSMIDFAILLLIFATAFQVFTLPMELNASKRALEQLKQHGIIIEDEYTEVDNMLKATSFIYIASLVYLVHHIIRLFKKKTSSDQV